MITEGIEWRGYDEKVTPAGVPHLCGALAIFRQSLDGWFGRSSRPHIPTLGKRYVLVDRDGKFCPAFKEILENEGVKPVLLPPRSPNLTPHLERFMRSK
jgi:hypothetical protein